MFALLFLLACGGPASEPAPKPGPQPVDAPAKRGPGQKVTKAAWVGDWVMGDKILAGGKDGQLKLMQDGDVVMSGPLVGKGLKRTAALDGCGATLKLSEVGGDIALDLDGPECPVDFIGTYTNTVSP